MDSYGINILYIARFSLLFSISELKAVCIFMLSDQKAYHCRHNGNSCILMNKTFYIFCMVLYF